MIEDKDINILLVDDNDIDIVVNTKLLRLANFKGGIQSFHSGNEVISFIRSNAANLVEKVNVLLLDIQMPGIDGFETLQLFEAFDDDIKSKFQVFMLSSSIDRNDIIRAETNPTIRKVLEKPLDVYLLRRLIEQ
ncbi:MAG: two-component system response regulator [Flavobacteriales bacterium]